MSHLTRSRSVFLAALAIGLAAAAGAQCGRAPIDEGGAAASTPAAPARDAPGAATGAPPAPPPARPPAAPPAKLTSPRGTPPSAAAPASTQPAPPAPKAPRLPSIAATEAEIIRLTNIERASEDLPPLVPDAGLGAVARAHSRDMVERDYFSHENLAGEGPDERAERAGYDIRRPGEGGEAHGVGENIGQVLIGMMEDVGVVEQEARSIAAAQVRSWMDSRGHRSNILSEDYRRTGVGVAYDGKGMYICTQVFW